MPTQPERERDSNEDWGESVAERTEREEEKTVLRSTDPFIDAILVLCTIFGDHCDAKS